MARGSSGGGGDDNDGDFDSDSDNSESGSTQSVRSGVRDAALFGGGGGTAAGHVCSVLKYMPRVSRVIMVTCILDGLTGASVAGLSGRRPSYR